MVEWVCYPSTSKSDMWTEWHEGLNKELKAKHAVAMRFLVAGHWKPPHYKPLQGKHLKELGEILIHGSVQWRIIGDRDNGRDRYTILMICSHKDKVYAPKAALETAAERWREMKNGLEGVVVCIPNPN